VETVPNLIARVKEFTQAHGIDFENDLLSYNVKRKGIISTVSFHRSISLRPQSFEPSPSSSHCQLSKGQWH
jgi:hypothetical protein